MTARLAPGVWVGALRRRVEAAGGFATVLVKGNPDAGTVLLLLRKENGAISAISMVNTGTGETAWQTIFENRQDTDEQVSQILDKRRQYDPDMWIVELDVADPARFIDGRILKA